MSSLAPTTIFEELKGRQFDSARELEACVVELFNRHLPELPPHYSYRELIEWGRQHDMIIRDEERGVYIVVEMKVSKPRRSRWPLSRFWTD